MIKRMFGILTILFLTLASHGCSYTNKTVLPADIKTIYVDTVQNAIPVNSVYAYEAGLEMAITQAIIRRLEKDGNLKVVPREQADAVLQAKLTGFEQEGVRFSRLESVEEYRLFIILNMKLLNNRTQEVLWEEPNFSGDQEYFVSQVRSIGRQEAALQAIDRLARNVVDRIVEDW